MASDGLSETQFAASRYRILEGVSTEDLDTYTAHKQERLRQGSLRCPCLTCERVRAEMEKP